MAFFDQIEDDVDGSKDRDRSAIQSIAISLKRIADFLDSVHEDGLPVFDVAPEQIALSKQTHGVIDQQHGERSNPA